MTKKSVVAYTRVSTASKEQTHSFGYQNEYWQSVIENNPSFEFKGIYADYGISGSSVSKRPQFMQMIDDAEKGYFQVICTKSVSRFGRNTEELLSNVRHLREIGVQVLFEKENIDSLDPSAELMLTIAAAVAENDLRIYSENQKWSIRDRFKNGHILIGSGMFGYKLDPKTNELIINEEQAKTVRRIFELCLEGKGLLLIKRELEKENRANYRGECSWSKGTIRYILSNEKYKGSALLQKTVTKLGVCKKNDGVASQYYAENTHKGIVSADTFDKVQQLIKARAPKIDKSKMREKHPLSGKFVCKECGSGFTSKIQNKGKKWETLVWVCSKQSRLGKTACDCTRIKESVLEEKFLESYNEMIDLSDSVDKVMELKSKLNMLLSENQELVSMRVQHLISLKDYEHEVRKLRDKIENIHKQIAESKEEEIKKNEYVKIEKYSEEKLKFVKAVHIMKGFVTFEFINGIKITKPYNNGKAGNQIGWKDKQ